MNFSSAGDKDWQAVCNRTWADIANSLILLLQA
jgi:hypothetical protein